MLSFSPYTSPKEGPCEDSSCHKPGESFTETKSAGTEIYFLSPVGYRTNVTVPEDLFPSNVLSWLGDSRLHPVPSESFFYLGLYPSFSSIRTPVMDQGLPNDLFLTQSSL